MFLRLSIAVAFLLLAGEEFLRTAPEAAEVVRKPGELMDALLSGDGSVGPWLLMAYGLLMLVRAWAHRR